ncbi:hypothetical protein [Acetobacter ghanensis]|uniref:hypothetical protein n=1 Tax=Acetobacter ghanensis TaxID=431306 RepID=UPI00155EBD35
MCDVSEDRGGLRDDRVKQDVLPTHQGAYDESVAFPETRRGGLHLRRLCRGQDYD